MSKAVLWEPLLHSFVCGFFTTLISVPLGSVLAWLMIRTDLPGKKVLGILITVQQHDQADQHDHVEGVFEHV